jgi:hypothetical protein
MANVISFSFFGDLGFFPSEQRADHARNTDQERERRIIVARGG